MTLGNVFEAPGFGKCNVNPFFPKPCMPAVTEWSGAFKGLVTSYGGNPLTEESKGTCSQGCPGCIEIVQTGQVAIPGMRHVRRATAEHQGELDCAGSPLALMEYPAEARTVAGVRKETVTVKEASGKRDAYAGEEVVYKVESYNTANVGDDVRKQVNWKILVDGEKVVTYHPGSDILRLEMQKEWMGKEVQVMPFLESPSEDVCVKTEVIKWFLPRVLIQTKTKEGFGRKEERGTYEYQDARGRGLTPPSTEVAPDMHYGDGKFHTNNFKLEDIKDAGVRKNIERLRKRSDADLFKLFRNLVEWTSQGNLEKQNLQLVNRMYQHDSSPYSNQILTNAVFEHESTKKWIDDVVKAFKKALSGNEGNLSGKSFSKIYQEMGNPIKRPSFSSKSDRINGLTIALNDTWGYRVTITAYSYNPQTKECQATLRYRIFDHFGLDVNDIESYGSKTKIKEKVGPLGSVLESLTTPHNDKGPLSFGMSPVEAIEEEVADGFCAWFILQHLKGYRPFVTIMEKAETIKFRI
jgi:hypothetical protein